MMDNPRWLLLLSVALLTLMVVAGVSYDFKESTPAVHPNIATMEVGGQRALDDAEHWSLGLGFGLVMIALLTTCLMLAADHAPQAASLRLVILAGGGLFGLVFSAMMLAYRDYVAQESPPLWGPFPTPTTWMIFGVWLTPAAFTAIYCFGFNKWFISPKDLAHDDAASPQGTTK